MTEDAREASDDEGDFYGSEGFAGRLRRLSARVLARRPVTITTERPVVTFTFDDFPRSALHQGGEILRAEGWHATYYASAGLLGRTNRHGAMFIAEDIASLVRDGHEIACHTFGHLSAAITTPEDYATDIERNAAALAELGVPAMTSFAWPFGEARPAHKRRLASRYMAARGIRPGVNRGSVDRMLLKAVALDGGAAGIGRAVEMVRAAAREPGWLIFFGHEVDTAPSPWGCTPEQLEAVARAVKEAGAEVLTMDRALRRFDLVRGPGARHATR